MRRSRLVSFTIAGVWGAALLTMAGLPPVSANLDPGVNNASTAPQKVIVVLRDQFASTPATVRDFKQAQERSRQPKYGLARSRRLGRGQGESLFPG